VQPIVVSVISLFCFALLSPVPASCGGFVTDEICHEAKVLMNRLDIPRDVSYPLASKLRADLDGPAFRDILSSRGVHAVLVVQSRGGGIVVKVMRGDGLVSFNGGQRAVPFTLASWTAGVMIGGSAHWSVGIVTGLASEKDFGGDYTGTVKGAIAAESHVSGWAVFTSTGGAEKHEIHLISTGRGLSANIGSGKMSISMNP
jgi:hypothetical protein